MPKVIKNNCTSGELDPRLHHHSELEQHANGLAKCENAIVSQYGGVKRRYGWEFINQAHLSHRMCLMRSFEFSEDQTYTLEIGHEYIRLFTEDATEGPGIIVNGSEEIIVIGTSYLESELRDLRFEQDGDVLFITHKNHHPQKLIRNSHIDWTIESADFKSGPFKAKDENHFVFPLFSSCLKALRTET